MPLPVCQLRRRRDLLDLVVASPAASQHAAARGCREPSAHSCDEWVLVDDPVEVKGAPKLDWRQRGVSVDENVGKSNGTNPSSRSRTVSYRQLTHSRSPGTAADRKARAKR